MLVAVCQVELFLPESGSLKQKRLILQSLKTRLRQKFNCSVAEVEANEKWQRAVLGVSMVANERRYLDQAYNGVLGFIESDGRALVVNSFIEIY